MANRMVCLWEPGRSRLLANPAGECCEGRQTGPRTKPDADVEERIGGHAARDPPVFELEGQCVSNSSTNGCRLELICTCMGPNETYHELKPMRIYNGCDVLQRVHTPRARHRPRERCGGGWTQRTPGEWRCSDATFLVKEWLGPCSIECPAGSTCRRVQRSGGRLAAALPSTAAEASPSIDDRGHTPQNTTGGTTTHRRMAGLRGLYHGWVPMCGVQASAAEGTYQPAGQRKVVPKAVLPLVASDSRSADR